MEERGGVDRTILCTGSPVAGLALPDDLAHLCSMLVNEQASPQYGLSLIQCHTPEGEWRLHKK